MKRSIKLPPKKTAVEPELTPVERLVEVWPLLRHSVDQMSWSVSYTSTTAERVVVLQRSGSGAGMRVPPPKSTHRSSTEQPMRLERFVLSFIVLPTRIRVHVESNATATRYCKPDELQNDLVGRSEHTSHEVNIR